MIDVTHQISAVRRSLGTRLLEAGEARVITVAQTYTAELDDVWDACTNPERIARWFLPVSGDLRAGGRYQLEGNAGGTVEQCDPPTGFTATWEYGTEVSWISLRLSPDGDGTRFELEHTAHVDDERWAEFGPGAVGIGWDMAVMGLALHLSPGAAMSPAEGLAWQMSDEGRQFATSSSEQWYAASLAAGTEPAVAAAARDRVTAFYTVVPEDAPAP